MSECGNKSCRKPLAPNGPSVDFCNEDCQKAWHALKATEGMPRVVGTLWANIPARTWGWRRTA